MRVLAVYTPYDASLRSPRAETAHAVQFILFRKVPTVILFGVFISIILFFYPLYFLRVAFFSPHRQP